jgi:hypothetical protein
MGFGILFGGQRQEILLFALSPLHTGDRLVSPVSVLGILRVGIPMPFL